MWVMFFGSLIALTVIGLMSFEVLLYLLYTRHPIDWERAGAPYVFGQPYVFGRQKLWIDLDRGLFARHRLQNNFLFHMPAWVKKDAAAYWVLIIHKISVIAVLMGAVGFPILALLLS